MDSDSKPVPFAEKNLIPWLGAAVKYAASSKVPDPKFSQYFVNCACLVIDKKSSTLALHELVRGGNIEYGLCQALHGEESLVAALKSRIEMSADDLKNYIVMIAFSSKYEDGGAPTCCGNCRDIMRDALPLNTMIFGGHPNGGKVIVARLWNLMGDEYHKSQIVYEKGGYLDPETRELLGTIDVAEATIADCLEFENNIYFPGKPNPGRRYCAVISSPGHICFGTHDVMCDYHPIYAIRDAVRQIRRRRPRGTGFFNYVLVASEHYFPDVMYKDRQHLLELNFQQECISGQLADPPVFLANYELVGGAVKIQTIHQTSVKKWLPFAFSPANFGEEFVKSATEKFKTRQ